MAQIKKKLDTFIVDNQLGMAERIAAFLDWAAKHMPKQPIALNLAYRSVMGYRHTPRMANEEVKVFRGKISRSRPVLQQKFGRDLVVVGGAIRATVDDEDVVRTALPSRTTRLKSAIVSMNNTTALVDPAKLPPGAAFAPYRRYFNDAKQAVKALAAPDFLTKLLPPGKEMPTIESLKTGTK